MEPKIKKENEKEKYNDRSYKRNPREDNYTLEENIHTFLEKNKDILHKTSVHPKHSKNSIPDNFLEIEEFAQTTTNFEIE